MISREFWDVRPKLEVGLFCQFFSAVTLFVFMNKTCIGQANLPLQKCRVQTHRVYVCYLPIYVSSLEHLESRGQGLDLASSSSRRYQPGGIFWNFIRYLLYLHINLMSSHTFFYLLTNRYYIHVTNYKNPHTRL